MEQSSTLKELKKKEEEVYNELKSSNLFKQWEGLKTTIQLFEGKNGNDEYHIKPIGIPTEYNAGLTWAEKILFVLNKINEGFNEDIVNEILKFDTSNDRVTVIKRVRGQVSLFLNSKKLKVVKRDGRKIKVAIK